MHIFLISGKAGSGKDLVATIIKENLPNTIITSLSRYIKLYVQDITSWDGSDATKPRTELQQLGDYLRATDINYLTKRIGDDIKVYENFCFENVVISDVRLLNEINYFQSEFPGSTTTIRVNSPKSKRHLTEEQQHHHTETELDNYQKFDYIINNNFDETIAIEVKKILEGMK